jgi:hypothetical protein
LQIFPWISWIESNSAKILTSEKLKAFGKRGWRRRVANVSTRLWTFYWHLPGVWSLRWGLTWNRMIEYWTRDL